MAVGFVGSMVLAFFSRSFLLLLLFFFSFSQLSDEVLSISSVIFISKTSFISAATLKSYFCIFGCERSRRRCLFCVGFI